MPNTPDDGILTAYDDDVTVVKCVDEVGHESAERIAKIEFAMRSQTDDRTQIRLADTLPSYLSNDDVGFHPDHDIEQWSVRDGVVEYEHELPPNGEHETLYAIRIGEDVRLDDFRHPVDLVVSSSTQSSDERRNTEDDADVAADTDEERSWARPDEAGEAADFQQTADATAGGGWDEQLSEEWSDVDSLTAHNEQASDGRDPLSDWGNQAVEPDHADTFEAGSDQLPSDEEVPYPDPWEELDEADERDLAAPPITRGRTASDHDVERADESGAAPLDEGVDLTEAALVDSLIDALRTHATREQIAALSQELNLQSSTSLGARIDYLQQEVGELAAYKQALQEFLDESGGAKEMLDAVAEDVSDLQSSMTTHDEHLERVETRLDEVVEVEERIGAIRGELDQTREQIEGLQREVETLRAQQVDERQLKDLTESVEELNHDVERLDPLDEAIEDLSRDLSAIRAERDRMSEDLEQIRSWQDTVRGTFANLVESDTSTRDPADE